MNMLDTIRAGAAATITAEKTHSKPCPFCDSGPLLPQKLIRRFVVECGDEECGTARYGDTPEAAVRAWNTRAGVTV